MRYTKLTSASPVTLGVTSGQFFTEGHGHIIEHEAGVVTIWGDKCCVQFPWANVLYAVPSEAPVKPARTSKK
jgi:hypothetical protein